MIKPNEIRIGNYLSYDEDATVFTVKEISETGFSVVSKTEDTWIDAFQFSGVRLTERWLKKFGFLQKFTDKELWHNNKILTWRLKYSDIEKAAFFISDVYPELGFGVSFGPRIEYVHQLQNIYFAVFNEEL